MRWQWPSNDKMTALEQNKYLGIAHLGYAAFQLLMTIVMMVFVGALMADISRNTARMGHDPFGGFMSVIFVFAGVVQLAFTIPSIVAGYGFLKRRPWAKIAGIVAGVVAAMSFPIGTALTVFTFLFLFSNAGKQLYDHAAAPAGPPPPPNWQ